jgi:hypothetical protein
VCKSFSSGYFWNYFTDLLLTSARPGSLLKSLERNHRRVRSLALRLDQSSEIFDFAQLLLPQVSVLSIEGVHTDGRLVQLLSKVNASTLVSLSITYACDKPDATAICRWLAKPFPRLKELRLTLRDNAPASATSNIIMIPALQSLAKSETNLETLEIAPDGAPAQCEKAISQVCLANGKTLKLVDVRNENFLAEYLRLMRLVDVPKSWKPFDDSCREKFSVGLNAFRSGGKSLWNYMKRKWSPEVLDGLFDLCLPSILQQAETILEEFQGQEPMSDESRQYFMTKGVSILAKALPEIHLVELAPLFKLAKLLHTWTEARISLRALEFMQATIDRNFQASRRVSLEASNVQGLLNDTEWSSQDTAIPTIQSCVSNYGTWLELKSEPPVLLNVIHFLGPHFFACSQVEDNLKQLRYESFYPNPYPNTLSKDAHRNSLLYVAYLRAHSSPTGHDASSAWRSRPLEDVLKEAQEWNSRVGSK